MRLGLPAVLGLLSASLLQMLQENFLYSSLFAFCVCFGSHYSIAKLTKNSSGLYLQIQEGLLASTLVVLFLVLVPLNLDRSISVWLLAKQEINVEMSDEDYQKYATEFFANSDYESQRRINEQLSLGNIERNQTGNLVLTSKGKYLLEISRVVAGVFHLNTKYTDGK